MNRWLLCMGLRYAKENSYWDLSLDLVSVLSHFLAKTIPLSFSLIYLTDFLIENFECCVEPDLMTLSLQFLHSILSCEFPSNLFPADVLAFEVDSDFHWTPFSTVMGNHGPLLLAIFSGRGHLESCLCNDWHWW